MPAGLPGVDVKFLANVVHRLSERRLHAYHPGSRRSAAALILRFDEGTQRVLTSAVASFRARVHPPASSAGGETSGHAPSSSLHAPHNAPLHLPDFLQYVQDRCVDTTAPSSLHLLFLRRADMDASRWSGQVAFPGGRRDPEDGDDFQTVCRETYEELGLPLQHHREFVCLGRLPDHKLHSRAVNSSGLIQARYVFLHVGDMTPTVQIATHVVESVRWMPLSRLSAAHVEHGCVVHPLYSFVHAQDADYRLLLTELFPSTYLSFPSISLPRVEGERTDSAASAGASPMKSWRVWGLTLRSANELLALDNRQPFDWPLVESNSRVLQYGLLYPFHGYYELLYQVYVWRAWGAAQRRRLLFHRTRTASTATQRGGVEEKDRRMLYGSAMERRYAALPVSADALLFAAPEQPVLAHVLCCLCVVVTVIGVLYTIAAVIAGVFNTVGLAVGVEAALEREERRRAYYDANVPPGSAAVRRGDTARSGRRRTSNDDGDVSDEESIESSATLSSPAATEETGPSDTTASTPSSPSPWWWQRVGGRAHNPQSRSAMDDAALAAALGGAEVDVEAKPSAETEDVTPTVSAEAASVRATATRSTLSDAGEARRDGAAPSLPAAERDGIDARRAQQSSGNGGVLRGSEATEDILSKSSSSSAEVNEAQAIAKTAPRRAETQSTSHAIATGMTESSYTDELEAVMNRYRET